ncbi:MAG: fasciclin domain-containing protein [Novosphingobium sp.]|nr:fasciclin domain-containing protein [Novosphingobium sp.]
MRPLFVTFSALALVAISGCGQETPKSETAAPAGPSTATLTAAVGDAAGMSTVSAALKGTGLNTVFDGTAPYTLLAPDDDAFGALGETAKMLTAPENDAAMAAVLKGHVLPGYVTVADIDAAIRNAAGKPVKMATMAGGEVTFARQGEDLTVTAADGSTAKVSGKEVTASNGVAIPLDAVLKKTPSPS